MAAPPSSAPAIPAVSGHRRPRHGAPYLTRSRSPTSIRRLRHQGAARASSSSVPAEYTSTATAPSPASPNSILLSVSILVHPFTSLHHSLELSYSPGHCRRGPPLAPPQVRRRQHAPVTLRLHRLHGRVPITPPVLMLPLIGTQRHPSPAAPFRPHLRPKWLCRRRNLFGESLPNWVVF